MKINKYDSTTQCKVTNNRVKPHFLAIYNSKHIFYLNFQSKYLVIIIGHSCSKSVNKMTQLRENYFPIHAGRRWYNNYTIIFTPVSILPRSTLSSDHRAKTYLQHMSTTNTNNTFSGAMKDGGYMRVCFFLGGKGGTPIRHGHKESYEDLNLKNSTSEWDSNPRTTSWILVWRSNHWAIRRSDESSLGIFKVYNVCEGLGEGGGGCRSIVQWIYFLRRGSWFV